MNFSSYTRIYNRIRSPRLVASGRWKEVGEGSRQNSSATLGKGMALRVGHRCPLLCAYAEQVLPDAIRRMAELRAAKVNGKECIRAFSV